MKNSEHFHKIRIDNSSRDTSNERIVSEKYFYDLYQKDFEVNKTLLCKIF